MQLHPPKCVLGIGTFILLTTPWVTIVMRTPLRFLVLFVLLFAVPTAVSAQTNFRWVGGGLVTPGNWNNYLNWLDDSNGSAAGFGNFPNSTTQSAIFSGASTNTTVTLGQNITVLSLQFNTSSAAAYTITGNTLTFASGNLTVASAVTNSQTVNSAIALSGALSITNNSTATGKLLTLGGGINVGANTLTLAGAGNMLVTGSITGTSAAALVKNGTGETVLFADNTGFTGTVTVNAGTLAVDGANQDDNKLANNTTVTVNNGGKFEIRGLNALPVNNAKSAGLGVNFNITSGGTLSVLTGQSTYLQVGQSSHAHANNITLNTSTVSFSNSGSGTVYNTEALQLDGNLTVNGGVSNIVYGTGGTASNANLSLNGASTWAINTGATLNVAPIILDGNGSTGSFTKTGTGILNLTGNNTYTGGTTINAGSIYVNGQTGTNSGTGTGAVAVNSTGLLGGTGRVAGAVTVASGGTVQAGNGNPIGTLTLGSTLGMASGSTLKVRMTSAGVSAAVNTGTSSGAANTVNNFLLIQGAATISSGMNIAVDGAGATFVGGTSYSYLVGDATNSLSGLNITTAGQFAFSNFNTTVTSVSLTGNASGNIFLNFTAVPEPGLTMGLGAAVLVGLGAWRRRGTVRG